MVNFTKERERVIKTLGITEEDMTDEQIAYVDEVLRKNRHEVIAYIVDSKAMHQMLAYIYMLDTADDNHRKDVARSVARLFYNMYRDAKPATLGDLSTIIETMEQQRNKDKEDGE